MIIQPSRRGFLAGLGFIAAAPAIVRFSSLMPVQPLPKVSILNNAWPPPPIDASRYSERALRALIHRVNAYQDTRVDSFGRLL